MWFPDPKKITNPYEQMEQDYQNYIRPEEERREAQRIEEETEAAIRYYNENYR